MHASSPSHSLPGAHGQPSPPGGHGLPVLLSGSDPLDPLEVSVSVTAEVVVGIVGDPEDELAVGSVVGGVPVEVPASPVSELPLAPAVPAGGSPHANRNATTTKPGLVNVLAGRSIVAG